MSTSVQKTVAACLERARENITAANAAMREALTDLRETEPRLFTEVNALLSFGEYIHGGLSKIQPPTKPVVPQSLYDIALKPAAHTSLEELMREGDMHDLSEFRFVPRSVVARRRGIGPKALKLLTEGLLRAGITLGGDWPKGTDAQRWKEVLAERRGHS